MNSTSTPVKKTKNKVTKHKTNKHEFLNGNVKKIWKVNISVENYIQIVFFYVLLTVHLSIFISVINQLDAQNFCFTISLFHASTCFEHMCSLSGIQNCITQPLVSLNL